MGWLLCRRLNRDSINGGGPRPGRRPSLRSGGGSGLGHGTSGSPADETWPNQRVWFLSPSTLFLNYRSHQSSSNS